jgi:hypothetical protein
MEFKMKFIMSIMYRLCRGKFNVRGVTMHEINRRKIKASLTFLCNTVQGKYD